MVNNPENDSARHEDPREKRTPITADSLWNDNHSPIADERRATWFEERAKGKLIKIRACSDARVGTPNPDGEIVVRYIAAGRPPPAPEMLLLGNSGVKGAVVMAHFDGKTAGPGKAPEGCGGLRIKDTHRTSNKGSNAIDRYIDERVFDPDPILQAVKSAKHLAAHANKPVLAVAQDHRSGLVYPIAAHYPWHDSLATIEHGLVTEAQIEYNPSSLYENGLETITIREDDIPPALAEFMRLSRDRAISVKTVYPEFYEESEIQDPSLIALSTCVIPFPARFPLTGARPGTVFEVFIPRTKFESSIRINPDDLQPSLEQMEYPVQASLDNHTKAGKPFASTNTILIDTEEMAVSAALAMRFVQQERWIPEWLGLSNHRIFVSETTEGVITQIEEFKT